MLLPTLTLDRRTGTVTVTDPDPAPVPSGGSARYRLSHHPPGQPPLVLGESSEPSVTATLPSDGVYVLKLTALDAGGEPPPVVTPRPENDPPPTANQAIAPYTTPFAYGSNMDYYEYGPGQAWSDVQVAQLIQSIGGHSIRPFLPDYFIQANNLQVRIAEFQQYTAMGMLATVCAVGEPGPAHRLTTTYPNCPEPAKVFANMYEPIWNDDGTVNANNFYAKYIYDLWTVYGPHIKVWEVVNEPDIIRQGNDADWATRDPFPSELNNLLAPIQSYARMLRITWEVIKTYAPDNLVTLGGLGYPNFLNRLLMTTDAPNGAVSAAYPEKAGAYFDMMCHHIYPYYQLRYWDNNIPADADGNKFVYTRTSDFAASKVIDHKNQMQAVLAAHGYDGSLYPTKHFICTEANISRRSQGDAGSTWRVGSDEMQRNFYMKTLILAQKNKIAQLYAFSIGEKTNCPPAGQPVYGYQEFDTMGLFENLKRDGPGEEIMTGEGIGFKTASQTLFGWTYDATRTALLNLPAGVEGAAFSKNGAHRYCLWAKQATDLVETTAANYTFPAGAPIAGGTRREWNHAVTSAATDVNSQSVTLGSAPSFFVAPTGGIPPVVTAAFTYGAGTPAYCIGSSANPTPTISGTTGGVFSAAPTTGLALNPTTGAIAVGSSLPGLYTVTYTVSGVTATQQVRLTAQPAAGFFINMQPGPLYAGATLPRAAVPSPGATAGVFSVSPAGLGVNPATGTLDLSNTPAGTYTITNTVAAAGGCGAATATVTVTVLDPPPATIVASGPTNLAAGESVTLSALGAPGSEYLWSTGATSASIVVTTAGSYTVEVTAPDGSSATSTPVVVTVSVLPSATFGYEAVVYSVVGVNPTPTITGLAGGTFSSAPAGLALDAGTGTIDLAASLPGAYVITYTTPGPNPATATRNITLIQAATPEEPIVYDESALQPLIIDARHLDLAHRIFRRHAALYFQNPDAEPVVVNDLWFEIYAIRYEASALVMEQAPDAADRLLRQPLPTIT